MKDKEHLCQIVFNSLPLVSEAYYMVALKHVVHPDRVTDFNVLIYLISGSMEVIEDGNVYELKEDTVFFLKSGVHHWGVKEYEVGTQWYYVHFYSSDLSKDYDNSKKFDKKKRYVEEDYRCYVELPKLMKLPSENDVKSKIAHLVKKFTAYNSSEIIFLNIELLDILTRIYKISTHGSTKVDKRVDKIIRFIMNNYRRNFSSKEIEDEIGLSYKYICTLFKEKSGMTIKQYQLNMRITEAERLLSQTQCTIVDIAQQLGFYDEFSFSKVFKRENGISPHKFRNDYIPKI